MLVRTDHLDNIQPKETGRDEEMTHYDTMMKAWFRHDDYDDCSGRQALQHEPAMTLHPPATFWWPSEFLPLPWLQRATPIPSHPVPGQSQGTGPGMLAAAEPTSSGVISYSR